MNPHLYFSLLGVFIIYSHAFVILPSKVILSTRLDPVVQPGQASSHLHNIVGGNLFSATYDPDTLLSSKCTSTPITLDKSNYWAPAMYYLNKSVSSTSPAFYRLPSTFLIYYLPRGENVQAFPKGLKMVAGSAMNNTYDEERKENQAISYVCLNYADENINGRETPGFPTTNCPDGIRAQVFFPTCWDGTNLDSSNHKDHMSYPLQQYNNGDCPSSHPVRLVSLFYEQIFGTGGISLNSDGETWILSNGDITGYSMHADFQNGWDIKLLQRVIDECGSESSNGQMTECAPLRPFIDEQARDACQIDTEIDIPEEDAVFYSNQLSKLLGDNPIWKAESRVKPGQSSSPQPSRWGRLGSLLDDVGSFGGSASDMREIVQPERNGILNSSTTGAGWEVRGCIEEGNTGRALTGASFVRQGGDPLMNLRRCAVLCENSGFDIAGLEFGSECYCDHALRNGASATFIEDKFCGWACKGNVYENCGGIQTLTILAKSGVTLRTISAPSSSSLSRAIFPLAIGIPLSSILSWMLSSS